MITSNSPAGATHDACGSPSRTRRTLDELHAEISQCVDQLATVASAADCIREADVYEREAAAWREIVLGDWEIQPRAARRLLIDAACVARTTAMDRAREWRRIAQSKAASTSPVPA